MKLSYRELYRLAAKWTPDKGSGGVRDISLASEDS